MEYHHQPFLSEESSIIEEKENENIHNRQKKEKTDGTDTCINTNTCQNIKAKDEVYHKTI